MLQWADTFNRYGTNAALMLNGTYAENPGVVIIADPDVSSAVKVAKIPTGSAVGSIPWGNMFRKVLAPATTVGAFCRVYLSALPADTSHVCKPLWFADNSKNTMVSLRITINGTIQAWRSNTNAPEVLLGESVACIVANAWQHIEAKVVFHASAGTVEVRVDGAAPVLSLVGQNTQGSGATTSCSNVMASNAYFAVGSGSNLHIKDFAAWDATGTYNNNFMGNCLVVDIDTNSDVALGWTPNSGGVGWSILDNNPPTDDAAYIGAAAAALTNTFGLTDLPADVTTVRGGVIVNRSRKIDGGDGNVQMGIISAAATGLGADRAITVAYTYWADVFEVDPNTGVPFTPANFNLAKLKMTRTL